MGLKIKQKLYTGFGISLIVLTIISILSLYSINNLIDRAKWIDHTQIVLMNLEGIISKVNMAESCTRGYGLTSKADFLSNYNLALDGTFEKFKALRELTKDNKEQQQRLDILQALLRRKFLIMNHTIEFLTKYF